MRLLCKILPHRRSRSRVWNDGMDFRTACTRCETPLIRDPQSAVWRPFTQADHDVQRAAKPQR